MISVACRFSVPLGRFEGMDYIRPLDISIVSFDELGKEIVLGKIAGDQLLTADAELDGVSLFDICDEDSQGMYELYEALFQEGDEFQPELALDEVTDHITFLWNATLHPKLLPYQQPILQVISELFGHSCVVVMWRKVSDLSDKQLSDLGFSRIAGTEFVFRHVALQTAYSKANPRGVEVALDFEADDEDEEWVMRHWKGVEGGASAAESQEF